MIRYENYKEDCSDVPWIKFKIVVPTERDKQELKEASEHLHYANVDTQFVAVNQLVHLYEDHPLIDQLIVVDPTKFDEL